MRPRLPPHPVGVVVGVQSITTAYVRLAAAVAACLAVAAPAGADNWTFHGFDPPSSFTGDVGLRFWYGKGTTGKSLFDPTGTMMVSRLTYENLMIFAPEAYGRIDLNTGWFVKGLIGGGAFRNGKLIDEDFPPGISP